VGLVAEHSENLAYQASLADALGLAGYQVFYEREPDLETNKKEANELCERSVALWEKVTQIDARTEYASKRAAANYRFAVIARDQKDGARARTAFEVARQWQTQTLKQERQEPMHRSELARVCNSMAYYLAASGDLDGALECAGTVTATLQGMVGTDDADPRDEMEWYLAHKLLIDVAKVREPGRAIELVRAVLPAMERRAKLNPQNGLYARQLIEIQQVHFQLQKAPADVIVETTKMIDLLSPLNRDPNKPQPNWNALLDCYSRRAQALAGLGRLQEALRDHDEGIALIKVWPGKDKHRQVDFLRERYRDCARWQRTLGRFRESARSADAAAGFAEPTEAWSDRLNAAEARALDGDVGAAYSSALALEKDPNFDVVRALDPLTKIYDRHSDHFSKDTYTRKRNDTSVTRLLTLALQKTGEDDSSNRMRLHELRSQRHAAGGRWDAAGDDLETVLKLADPARAGYYRERAALMRTNSGKPAEAMALLEPLGRDVPDRQLFSLALAWVRLAANDKLSMPDRDKAARQALSLLEVKAQRKSPFMRSELEFIDIEELWRPVRNLDVFKKWREGVVASAK